MPNVHADAVSMFLVGDARIVTPNGTIEPSSKIVFATALYLGLEAGRVIGRRELEERLWPSADPRLLPHRLRQTLFKLRRLGFPAHTSGRNGVFVPTEMVTAEYNSATGSSVSEDGQHQIDVLPGFDPSFSSSYCRWLDTKKSQIGEILVRQFLEQISLARKSGRWPIVETKARNLLHYAPENEEATLALSESLALRGEKLRAVRLLDRYLEEVGSSRTELSLPAKLLRRRIVEQAPPIERAATVDSPLVGREPFSAGLTELLETSRQGRAAVVLISGAAGMGKSRLVTDFLSFATLQGITCHKVTCRSTDSNRPLAVLLELIPLLRGTRGAIGSLPTTLEFFDALITHRPSEHSIGISGRPNDFGSSGLDAALLDIIDAVSDEGVIAITIEDCQWIDTQSAIALTRVFEKLTNEKVLVILTTRGLPTSTLPALQPRPVLMNLPPLDQFASQELLRSIVASRGQALNGEYLHWCVNVAEGNPYFLHELANNWIDTQQEHAAPPSLTSVLNERLSLLTDKAIQVLQTCAVLENHATMDNLEALLGMPAHQLLQSIDDLATAGMLTASSRDSQSIVGRIASRHDLLSDVALERLSSQARQYLHRRAAKLLEETIEESGDASTLWSCAKHWQLAGDNAQALRVTTSCARHLLDVGLFADAVDAFSRAQRYCGNDADLLQNLEGQAVASYRSSDWQRANEIIQSARALKAKLSPSDDPHDDLELMQLRADWQRMNWNNILSRSLQCLNTDKASDRHRIEGGVMALMMLSLSNDRAEAAAVSAKIESLKHVASNTDVLLQARMIFHTNWGSFSVATKAASELLDQHRDIGEAGTLFRSLCNASVTFRGAGLVAEAKSSLLEAVDLAEQHNLQLSKVRALPMLANLALEMGQVDEARRRLHELGQCSIGADDVLANAEISAISARIALLDRDWPVAQRCVEEDLAYMRNDQGAHRRAYAFALRVAVELGMYQRAQLRSMRELEAAHLTSRSNLFQAFATYALYVGLLSVGKQAKAKRLLDEYLSQYRREPTEAPAHLLSGLLATLTSCRQRSAAKH